MTSAGSHPVRKPIHFPPSLGAALEARYEILEVLGQGGMGTVYEARDRELDRLVALKVIRPDLAGDPDILLRFKQELILARQITHKNVIRIFDFGVADDLHFISMEYVEGQSLLRLVRERGKFTPEEAARIMFQICQGLASAHAEGVVHCDLKPGNIMMDRDGRVVILDFGTARWLGVPQGPAGFSGTLAYMSPEQARGDPLDRRSDVYSAGVIFYQLLVGRLPIRSDTRQPPPSRPKPPAELDPTIPRALNDVVMKCMAYQPAARYQSAEEICQDLQGTHPLPESSPAQPIPISAQEPLRPANLRWRSLVIALAIIGMLITGGVLYRLIPRSSSPAVTPALTRLTGDSGLTAHPAFSPDGKFVAYATDRDSGGNLSIWIQSVVDGQSRRLTQSRADDLEPAFSPDGHTLVFRSEREGGGIYVIPIQGGEPKLIARHGRRPRFSPDGAWILYWVRDETWSPSKIYVVPSAGGSPKQVRPEFDDAHYPIWSPDGKAILFCGTRNSHRPDQEGHDWWVTEFGSESVIKTGAFAIFRRASASQGSLTNFSGDIFGTPGQWVNNEIILSGKFGDSENLWRLPISGGNWKVTAAPQRLTFGATLEMQPAVSSKVAAFAALTANMHIWTLGLERGKESGEPERLTTGAGFDFQSSISNDGRRVAFISDRSGNRDVWLKEINSGHESNLTPTPEMEGYPRISPDGGRVAYRVIDDATAKQVIYVVPAEGGKPEVVCGNCGLPADWSPDARLLLFEPGSVIPAIGLLDLNSGEKSEIVKDARRSLRGARFSPDGQWIAFYAENSLHTRIIYIVPFRAGGVLQEKDWVAITNGAALDTSPCWSADGSLLYFLSERDGFRCVFAQRLQPGTKRPVDEPFAVHHFHTARRSLLRNLRASPSQVGLSAAPRRLVFSLDELAGNIWMTKIPSAR